MARILFWPFLFKDIFEIRIFFGKSVVRFIIGYGSPSLHFTRCAHARSDQV
ncbi:hypothetical protein D3C87_952760 [compost metagenome]